MHYVAIFTAANRKNTVYHGLESKNGKNILIINGFSNDDEVICFEIIDYGIGMILEKLNELNHELQSISATNILTLNSDRSLGLLNIAQRIKLKYGDQYGIRFSSNTGSRTTVTIKF